MCMLIFIAFPTVFGFVTSYPAPPSFVGRLKVFSACVLFFTFDEKDLGNCVPHLRWVCLLSWTSYWHELS